MIDFEEKRHTASFKATTTRRCSSRSPTPDPNTLTLDGLVDGRTLHALCHRAEAADLLLTRGFHWVNEYPDNR